jgi:hypothetical protein
MLPLTAGRLSVNDDPASGLTMKPAEEENLAARLKR